MSRIQTRISLARSLAILSFAGAMFLAGSASASTLTYDITTVFSNSSGGPEPAGPLPWLRATFDDGGSSGSVTLTMTALNLTGTEKLDEWYFNIDPAFDPENLVFSAPTKIGTFDDPVISQQTNQFKTDGDGKYDVKFTFSASTGHEFGPGESVSYTITGIPTLTADSFKFLSAPAGGAGPFYTAVHIQGIEVPGGTNNSVWAKGDPGPGDPVPEPSTIVLGLIACCG